ncbi:MAG: hypothetical protein R3270_00465 [Gammaproteobacteria bacterium]|nr:hypothetical protein [Gammaproteobacteria bacterium]
MDARKATYDKTEDDVLEDIQYFERQLQGLDSIGDRRSLAASQVYRLLLRQRRQYLNALRDGQPERWPDYPEN